LRYHAKRRRFFENFSNFIKVSVVFTGSSAFMAVLGNKTDIALVATFLISILSALNLVFDFSKRALVHADLRKRFSELLKEIIIKEPTEENLKTWEAEKVLIEIDEPTALKVLDIHCHNEEAVALGYGSEDIYKLGWWRILLKDWWSCEAYEPVTHAAIERRRAEKAEKKHKKT